MAKTMLFGKAALTAVRLQDGTRANIPAGRAVPNSIEPSDAARLVAEGFLIEVELLDPVEVEPEGPAAAGDLGELLAGNVGDILDTVGDDAELAAQLLELEVAKEKPRATLVTGLEETIEADQGGNA